MAGALADQATVLGEGSLPAEIRCAGGAARSDLWLQIKADVLGVATAATACCEPTSLGAAVLAHAAIGGSDVQTTARQWVQTEAASPPRSAASPTIPSIASQPDHLALNLHGRFFPMTKPTDANRRTIAPEEASRVYLYSIVLVAAVGGFLFGYDISLISGAMLTLKEVFHLTDKDFWYGAMTGSAILGCPFGLLGGRLAGRHPRQKADPDLCGSLVHGVGAGLRGIRRNQHYPVVRLAAWWAAWASAWPRPYRRCILRRSLRPVCAGGWSW